MQKRWVRDLLFVVVIAAVFGTFYYLSKTGTPPPYMPVTAAHTAAKTKEECLACHGKGMVNERKGPHPPKDDCLKCHTLKPEGAK